MVEIKKETTLGTSTGHAKGDPAEKVDARSLESQGIVRKYVKWAAGLSLIPVPLLDMAAVIGAQVKMVGEISAVYEVQFAGELTRSLIVSLLSALGAGWVAGGAVGSLAKWAPGIGTAAAFVALPAMNAATTYGIGRVFDTHFAAGGTLLDFEPAKMVAFFKAAYEESLHRKTGTA